MQLVIMTTRQGTFFKLSQMPAKCRVNQQLNFRFRFEQRSNSVAQIDLLISHLIGR